jgi:U2-associated protein SR140
VDFAGSSGFRQKLRKLEVALIEYRESLEEHGVKNLEEIEKRVASHRKKLEAECGLVDAPTPSSRDRDSKGGDPGVDRRSSGASGDYVLFIPVD